MNIRQLAQSSKFYSDATVKLQLAATVAVYYGARIPYLHSTTRAGLHNSHTLPRPCALEKKRLLFHRASTSMSDNTPTSTFGDEPGQIAAVAILGVVIILLFGVAVVGFCVFLRKRELLCFRTKRSSTHKNYSDTEYSYLYEKQNERVAPRRRFLNKAQNKLQRSQTKQRADPFNKRFSEIPLDIDLENEPGNWENPLFDHKNDAAISIQSWWRMIR